MNLNTPIVLKQEDKFEFLVNLDWYSLESYKKNQIKKEISKRASSSGYGYGVSYDFSVEGETPSQMVGFAEEKDLGFTSGALALADTFHFQNKIFITLLTNEMKEHLLDLSVIENLEKEYYWCVVFGPDGRILINSDKIIPEDEVETFLSDSSYENYSLVTTKGSIEDVEEDDSVEIISLYDVLSDSEDKSLKIHKIEQSSNVKKTFPLIALGSAAVALTLFSILSVNPNIERIKNEEFNKESKVLFSKARKEVDSIKEESKPSNVRDTVSQEQEVKKVKKEIKNDFEKVYYDNESLFYNISIIKKVFPATILGWKIEEIKFENNSFTFNYIVDKTNFKNFSSLDDKIKEIANNKRLKIQPLNLKEDGTNRIYEVIFDSYLKEKIMEKRNKEIEKEKKLEKIEKEIESDLRKIQSKTSNIRSSITSVSELNWFKKRFGSVVDDMVEQIEKDNQIIVDTYESLQEKIKNFEDLSKGEDENVFNNSWVNGDIKDLIVMMQNEKTLLWEYPNQATVLPEKKNGVILEPFVNIYPISVTPLTFNEILEKTFNKDTLSASLGLQEQSGSNEEEQYDYRLFALALSLLDKTNIIINIIQIEYKNNNFKIEGEFYEKV